MTRTRAWTWARMMLVTLLTVLAGTLIGTQVASAATPKHITLRFGHIQTTTHPHHKAALFFAKRMKALTNGGVEVQVFPAGQLGGEREMIESIQLGTLDLGLISSAAISNIDPSMGMFDLPYLFTTRAQAFKTMDGPIGAIMAKRLLAKGVRVLGWGDLGFREISANKPINTPADLKGVKIRVPESRIMLETFKALGAIPTSMAYPEVYTALEQHTIDAEENPLSVIYAGKFYEVNKFISLTNHQYMPMLFVVSEKVFAGLPKPDQAALIQAGKEAAILHRKLIKAANDRDRVLMEKAGVKFISPNLAPFIKATESVYNKKALQKLKIWNLVKRIKAQEAQASQK